MMVCSRALHGIDPMDGLPGGVGMGWSEGVRIIGLGIVRGVCIGEASGLELNCKLCFLRL